MKVFSLAALMGAVLTLIFAAQPAAAAPRCGCPPVVHHHRVVHRVIRRHIAYRHVVVRRVEYVDVQLEAPPPPPAPEVVWNDYGPYDATPQWDPQGRFAQRGDHRVDHWDDRRAHDWHDGHGDHWDHSDQGDGRGDSMDHGDHWWHWDHHDADAPDDGGR